MYYIYDVLCKHHPTISYDTKHRITLTALLMIKHKLR